MEMGTKLKTSVLSPQGAVLGHFTACAECGLLHFPDVEVSFSQGKDQTHLQPHLHHLLFARRSPNTQDKMPFPCQQLVLSEVFMPLIKVFCFFSQL